MSERTERPASPVGEGPAQNADAALLDALVREHRDAAVAYATRILGDAHLAEDAVQRAFLQILVRVRGGDDQLLAVNPRAVVLRGTRWAALKLAERHSSRDEAERRAAGEALVADDDHDWDRLEARMLVEDILPSLPEHYRDVLRLRYLEGRPDATAAEDLAVTLKAYRRRLDRALVVARVAALRIGVTSLGAGVLALLRRARARVARFLLASHHAAWSPVGTSSLSARSSLGHIVLAMAVVGLIVGTPLASHRALDPAAPRTGSRVAPSASAPGTSTAGVALASHGLALSRALPRARATARTAGPPSSAANETIDDVVITQIEPAPHASENHTAVATGYGRRCACSLFMQTLDGGATWRIYPAVGLGIVLPPDYPRDPRIFVRNQFSTEGQTSCVEQHISDGTCTPYPLVPYSTMVLDPRFDAGTPVAYLSTSAGAVAYNVETGRTQPLALNDGSSLNGVEMTAAGGAGRYSVYLLLRGTPASQATTVNPQTAADAVPLVGATHLVGCRSDGTCVVVANLPSTTYALYPTRDDSTGCSVIAYDGAFVYLVDAATGRVSGVRMPGNYGSLSIEGLGGGATLDLTVSGTLIQGAQRTDVLTWQAGRGWSTHNVGAELVGSPWPVVGAIGGGRLLLGTPMAYAGVWCSPDGGTHWARTCAAA